LSGTLGFEHVFEPAGTPAPPVGLLLLHGTGGNESDLLPLGRVLLPGAALLSPRGKVLERGMPRFFRRLAEGVFDQEDLAIRTAELARFIQQAGEKYALDPGKLVAVGFSNGANIAASLMLRSPRLLAGAILMRAMPPFIPAEPVDLERKPVLMLSGERDPIVQRDQVMQLANLLRDSHADLTLHWGEAGHNLAEDDVSVARDWLQRIVTTSPHGSQRHRRA
jgi:phospholipase/carboxylesterase